MDNVPEQVSLDTSSMLTITRISPFPNGDKSVNRETVQIMSTTGNQVQKHTCDLKSDFVSISFTHGDYVME